MGESRSTEDDQRFEEPEWSNLITGQVGGHIVQAGQVQGGVHLHAHIPDQRSIVSRQLFPPPRRFVGRTRELSRLHDLLHHSVEFTPTVVVLKGPGGVGKTALALRWLADIVHRFPDGQLHADLTLSTGEPVAPEDVLGQFLRALGVAPRQVPTGLAERTAMYRSVTAARVIAVLLDNAVSAAQARVLLPVSAASLAVVTSRRPLLGLLADGAQTVQVPPLDSAGALELLTRTIGAERVRAERDDARRLVDLCGGLPVALCVVAARALSRPRRPLTRMVSELRDEQVRLDALSAEGELSVRSTFDVAYADLPDRLRRVYRTLGLHPGSTFSVEAAAAALDSDLRTARQALDELVDASLLDEWGDNQYRFHDLIRIHALDQALTQDSDTDRAATIRRTLEWYLLAAQVASYAVMPARRVLSYEFDRAPPDFVVPIDGEDYVAAVDWLERHRANLVAATHDAAKCDWPELTYHLADALQPLFILHGHHRDAIEVGEVALRAAQSTENIAAEHSVRKRLARLYAQLEYFDHAERHVAIMLSSARNGDDRRAEASALKSLGLLLVARHRFDQAIPAFHDSLDILRRLGKRRGTALLLIDLGSALLRLGRTAEATDRLREAREIFGTLSPADPYNEARAAAVLGQACAAEEDFGPARELLRQAIAVLAGYGADYERARAHHALAELSSRIGDDAEAMRHQHIAATLYAGYDVDSSRPADG